MSAFEREDLARRAAIDDVEAAVEGALAALERLRGTIHAAYGVMPSRHVASYVGLTDRTLRRWRGGDIPPMAALRAARAHLQRRPK